MVLPVLIRFCQKSAYREVLLFKLFLSIAKQKVSFQYLKIKVCSVNLRNPCCQFGPDTDITDGTEEIGLDPDKVDRWTTALWTACCTHHTAVL